MNNKSLPTILALAFLLLTAGGYYYIWTSSLSSSETSTDTSNTLDITEVADISGMKDQASKLTTGTENNAGLPIPAPTNKLGVANPFISK